MKYAKVKQGQVPPVCLALMVMVFWLLPCSAQAAAGEYAVQIAAIRSQQCAEDLRAGLYARGLEAYWVRIALPEHGVFYRVRLGKFPSIETAYSYAESLLDSGLLESYAITTYEKPNSIPLRDTTQASLEVQEFIQQPPTPRDTKDLLAAIGSRQWWLPNNRSLFTTTPQLPPVNLGLTPREVLVYALSRKEWRLSYDGSVLFVRAPVVSSSFVAVTTPAKTEAASAPISAPPVNTSAAINTKQPVTVPGTSAELVGAAPTSVPKATSERSFALDDKPLTPPPPPGFSSSSAPVVNTGNSNVAPASNNSLSASNKSLNATRSASSDIGRGSKPTTSKGIGYGRIAPPRLQASAELRNGQLVMRIRNLDEGRPFTGTARVTLSDDRKSRDLAPMKFGVNPEEEFVVPINESVIPGDDWMLMVYDENGALRLLRGQTIGEKPQQLAQNNRQSELSSPPYVTPVFDATTSSGQIPPVGTVPVAQNADSMNAVGNTAVTNGSGQGNTPSEAADPTAPAQLTITPKLIAVTTENVTMEFEIASPQPLQYISVTLAAGEHRDTRQALMSTTRGRVPFLVPAAQAQGAFLFEIKDESGRTLAGGAGDFRQMTSGR